MADRLLGILRHQALKFDLRLLVLEMCRLGPRINCCEFRPRVGRGHIDNPYSFYSWLWRLDPKEFRRLAILDAAPELTFRSENKVLIQGIGVDLDLDPFATAGNHRQDRIAGRDHPHIMLQLRRVFLHRALLRELPRQHELCLEHVGSVDPTVERRHHPG